MLALTGQYPWPTYFPIPVEILLLPHHSGGWGFSTVNTMNPDIVDTTASLRAFSRLAISEPNLLQAWNKGIAWAISMQNSDGGIQNPDGGWGESCKSDLSSKYIPRSSSNLTQTAWALDALIASADKVTPEINAGIDYLLRAFDHEGWTTFYPVGQGMGGGFYIHYHSYRYIFPLLALANFRNKFQK